MGEEFSEQLKARQQYWWEHLQSAISRPLAFGFNGVEDERWRVVTISAGDLEMLSWTPSFSPWSSGGCWMPRTEFVK